MKQVFYIFKFVCRIFFYSVRIYILTGPIILTLFQDELTLFKKKKKLK